MLRFYTLSTIYVNQLMSTHYGYCVDQQIIKRKNRLARNCCQYIVIICLEYELWKIYFEEIKTSSKNVLWISFLPRLIFLFSSPALLKLLSLSH